MSTTAPTFSQIKAQVQAIPEKSRQGKAIGIRAVGRWAGQLEHQDGNRTYVIQQCDSPLAMRMALRLPAREATTTVLITPLDDTDLSDDIKLRLAKRRLFQIDSWQIVRSLFQARAVDPRLTRHPWIAEALLEAVPVEGYPAARGGFLDADTVWPLLLGQAMGLGGTESPDLTSVLKWSLEPDGTARFRDSSSKFQEGAIEWLAEKGGRVVEVVLRCIARLNRPDAVPLGLAAGVVFNSAASGKLDKATGKVEERFLGGQTAQSGLMLRWHTAAVEVVRALKHTDLRSYRQTLARADEILRDVQADGLAHLSDTSPLGFDQRLARFGQALARIVEHRSWSSAEDLQAAHQAASNHDQASREIRRMERIEMAHRLVRWLEMRSSKPAAVPRSFAEAAAEHLTEGGYVDWARLSLRAGDPVRELSEAYARLFAEVTGVREQQAERFARLLTDWTAAGSQGDQVVPVERILDELVAPLVAENPVLVIVIDGMSVAVCRELLTDLVRHEWTALCEAGRNFNRPGLAVIPSVTEFSRTSLWCGRLQQGAASTAEAGFAEHASLLTRCRSSHPPILFHKVALQEADDAILAKEVRDAIQSSHRKIVGVVVNAVDDHLLKGEQIDVHWSRDEIKVLPALLHEARIARRLVVLVADHGHVLDTQTQYRAADGGERWRLAIGAPAADELLVEGNRVLVEGRRLIAPWSERVRYAGKKNGYHGGLTPQEMIVPIVVLASTDNLPSGWQEQPEETPAWWDATQGVPTASEPAPRLKPTKAQMPTTLFNLDGDEETAPTPSAAAAATPQWITRLLQSPMYDEQRRLVARGLPADDILAKLLGMLDARGGKMTTVALARALVFPELRLPGLLSKVQRLLNVDGYAVLSRDETSNTVELNRDLLLKQFDLV